MNPGRVHSPMLAPGLLIDIKMNTEKQRQQMQ